MKSRGTAACAEEGEGVPQHAGTDSLPEPPRAAEADWRLDPRGAPQWGDWRWQMRNRLRTPAQLSDFLPGLQLPPGLSEAAGRFPLAITPYYAALIRPGDSRDPILQMSLPRAQELRDPPFLRDDPLDEDADMPVPGLVHRYADRALLMVTTACAAYCRHCTRKRTTGTRETVISEEHLRQAVAYLTRHREITDVIVSGGDPLTLPTAALERVLQAVRQVPSVEIIRLGTRAPVVLPMRVTDELTRMLRKYHPLWVNTHFNHPRELTAEAVAACGRLADAGVPLGNQTVLLRGINDNARVMERLCRGLVRARVRPYYLFQCDLVRGVEHFRTPLSRGLEIMEYLRGRVSGLAIPTFIVDIPHGGGKIPLLPNYVVSMSPTHTVLRNFEGMLVGYPEPGSRLEAVRGLAADGDPDEAPATVWDLARGRAPVATPANSARLRRRARRGGTCASD